MRLCDALAGIRAQLPPMLDCETIALSAARGRVLAEDLTAAVDLPHWDSAAVDGFAVRGSDLASGGTKLRVVGEAAAGHPFRGSAGPGEAVRILTGAELPQGMDLVVMQEVCRLDGAFVLIEGGGTKRNWRPRGEDVAVGALAIPAGRRLQPQDVALAGALGCRQIKVRRQTRVGLFSTGDELREPGSLLGRGQIWDGNRCLLRGLLERLGCEVRDFGILRDQPDVVEGALSRAAKECDLLVTSGGMSVGTEDHMRRIIGRRGALEVWPLAIKPGKPVGLGDIDDCPIVALPGNPIAAVVAFIALGRSVVNAVAGASDDPLPAQTLPAAFSFRKTKGTRQFLLAELRRDARGASVVAPSSKQGTAMLSALTGADGFAVIGEDCEEVHDGDLVDFLSVYAYLG
jgi:molybdopterin molybdotransferase